MKLRSKVLSFALPLTLIPFALTALAVYYFVIRAYQLESDAEQNKRLAEIIVNLRREQEAARKDIELIAKLPAIVAYLEAVAAESPTADLQAKEMEARTTLRLFTDQNPHYLQLGLVDMQGQERIKISNLPGGQQPGSLKGKDYFRRALIIGEAQSPVEQVSPGRFAFVLACLVRRDKYCGVIVLHLNTDLFQRSMRPPVGKGLATFLFDDRGLVFAKAFAGVEEERCLQQLDLPHEAMALVAKPAQGISPKEISSGRNTYLFTILPTEVRTKYIFGHQPG